MHESVGDPDSKEANKLDAGCLVLVIEELECLR